MLKGFLRLGDEVYFAASERIPENIYEVICYSERYFGRTNYFKIRPGKYLDNGSVILRSKFDGKIMSAFCHYLELVNENDERLSEFLESSEEKSREHLIFVRDLPDSLFWEGDFVKSSFEPDEVYVVDEIDYSFLSIKAVNGRDYDIYKISKRNDSRVKMAKESSLELIERGNIWKFFHGGILEFSCAAEEQKFNQFIEVYKELSDMTKVS